VRFGSWRLRWAWKQLTEPSNFAGHRDTLISPWKFWFALGAKLVPNLWRPPIRLSLRPSGAINVVEFMTLFIYQEIFVDKCYDYPPIPLEQPVIVDVGANTGLFAVRMKQLYPRAQIHCYEPLPSNFVQLQQNLRQSGFGGCSLFNTGVGASSRAARLHVHDRNIGGHSLFANQVTGTHHVDIELVGLPTVIDRLDGRKCTLLKLDCEGAEYEILRSLDRNLGQYVENIVFEATPSLYDVNELVTHLEHAGYVVERHAALYVATARGASARVATARSSAAATG
jgi:FkbM family methyltransferase